MEYIKIEELSRKFEEAFSDIKEIKSLLKNETENVREPGFLSLKRAIGFLQEQGFPISKSRMYKLTAMRNSGLPFQKFGNRLVFNRDELIIWCKTQIQFMNCENSIDAIVKSARKSIFR